MLAFLTGLALGFFGSVPAAGPLALAIVSSALEHNRARALRLAISGALAECTWAAVALFGIGRVKLEQLSGLTALRVAGVVILTILGVSMLRARPVREASARAPTFRVASEFALGFLMVATNPSFLIAWTGSAIFVMSLPKTFQGPTWAILLGAFIGVVAWFAILTALVMRARTRLQPKLVRRFVRALGVLVLGLAVVLAVETLRTN